MAASISSPSMESYRGPLLTIVRHGETLANVAHVLQGQTDSPLTARGQAQVLALGKRWRPCPRHSHQRQEGTAGQSEGASTEQHEDRRRCVNGLPAPTLVVSSPTGRARTTASSIFLSVSRFQHQHNRTPDAGPSSLSPSSSRQEGDEATRSEPESEPCFLEDTLVQALDIPIRKLDATSERTLPRSSRSPPTTLLLDPLLMEQDFGKHEGTRRRVHVPGFAFPDESMRGESREVLGKRIARAGLGWFEAVGMGEAVNRFGRPIRPPAPKGKGGRTTESGGGGGGEVGTSVEMRQAVREAGRLTEEMQREDSDEMATARDPTRIEGDSGRATTNGGIDSGSPRGAKRARVDGQTADDLTTTTGTDSCKLSDSEGDSSAQQYPHIVLVSHGLAISTFLNYFQPALPDHHRSSSSSTSTSFTNPASYPFASNTGYFTIGIRPVNRLTTSKSKVQQVAASASSPAAKELFLLRTNDTAHLAQLGALGRGGAASNGGRAPEKGLQNIASFFAKSPAAS
ncbi:hypothetical protein V8E36_006076 [Tilletia maclaganii]